jgi:hypothetical protein
VVRFRADLKERYGFPGTPTIYDGHTAEYILGVGYYAPPEWARDNPGQYDKTINEWIKKDKELEKYCAIELKFIEDLKKKAEEKIKTDGSVPR